MAAFILYGMYELAYAPFILVLYFEFPKVENIIRNSNYLNILISSFIHKHSYDSPLFPAQSLFLSERIRVPL